MMSNSTRTPSRLQQGSTLLVAVVILLLASLMALMAMNVGVFEQRSSGNDLRAKIVHQVAEAGLAQGFEYLLRVDRSTAANPAYTLVDDPALWVQCGATETAFPCGAVDASMRGSMFKLKANAGGYTDAGSDPLASELTQYMLPNTDWKLPAMGGFDVAYGVAPVLCRVRFLAKGETATQVPCSDSTDIASLSKDRIVTFVSVAQVRGESGRTTLTQTVARSSLLAQPAGVPTIIASGTVVPPGNGDVVAMPDAAGPGLDIAVWSRLNVEPASGSFATCSRQDFLASGGQNLLNAGWQASRTCEGCNCGMAKKSGDPEGWDILDKDVGLETGTNKNVKPAEFPCDLFEYAFNVKAWKDGASPDDDSLPTLSGDNDGFCESRMPKVAFKAPNGNTYQLYPEEAFMYQYAAKIKPAPGNEIYVRAEQLFTGTLGAADNGMVWCQVDCLPNGGTVGTVTKPVAVIVDPGTNTPFHATLFGLLFYRANGDGPLLDTTGGNAGMKFNAGSAVYGSMVIQGQVETGSGGGLLFGDADVLKALAGLQSMVRYDTLRGGWTDAYSY